MISLDNELSEELEDWNRLSDESFFRFLDSLEDAWPDMPDLTDGIDRFSQYPVAGEDDGEKERHQS